MAEVKFLLYSDPDFMLVKSIRMQVFMSEQNIKGEEEFDELDKRALFALLYDGQECCGNRQNYGNTAVKWA